MSMNVRRSLTRIQPCGLCDNPLRVPSGAEAEYRVVLGTSPEAPTLHLVCDSCTKSLMGPWANGRASNPRGVKHALEERYGSWTPWTSTDALPALLNEAATYLASPEYRDGLDFGSWQKMCELIEEMGG